MILTPLFLAQMHSAPPDFPWLTAPVGLFVLLLAALWILFPFIVWWQVGTMLKLQKKQVALLTRIADNTSPGVQAGRTSSASYDMMESDTGGMTIAIIVCVLVAVGLAALLILRRP